jgi:RNA polymerase sigma-70 factor (ECF subfamily)
LAPAYDYDHVSDAASGVGGRDLLAAYDQTLPHVYGYLMSRCGQRWLAEDLTAETFLAAVDAVHGQRSAPLTRAWLIGIARHKLADHWRREAREQLRLQSVRSPGEQLDPWDAELDRVLAQVTLSQLSPTHRLVLTLRYVDDLPVPEVAELIGRTVHATEALLVRARAAFRRSYPDDDRQEGDRD